MARLISAARETFRFTLPNPRKPMQVGYYETVMPAPRGSMIYGDPFDCSEDAAANILERHGRKGIVTKSPEESDEAALERAKQVRYDWLVAALNGFRNHNATLRAQGIPVLMPRQKHRDWMKELEALHKELNRGLLEGGDVSGPIDMIADQAAKELEKFGLTGDKMVPGVEQGLSGIGEL